MSRVSPEFGTVIKDFLARNKLTFRAAGFKSNISAAYWKDMADGRVPSEDMISKMAESFDELDEQELRAAAGYVPIPGRVDAVRAVEFALRGQKSIPEEGKSQILDFVRRVEEKYVEKG
ncbi:MAG: hypothetical protein HYX78_15685 [Armatimonadetes bacterium]|nr:hypothetical protein [Armatimonadota bacterium]